MIPYEAYDWPTLYLLERARERFLYARKGTKREREKELRRAVLNRIKFEVERNERLSQSF